MTARRPRSAPRGAGPATQDAALSGRLAGLRTTWGALAVAAAVALGGPMARAQPLDQTVAEHEKRGRQAYAEGRYADCIAAYRQADALAPSERYSYNIGKCSERAGLLREAIASFHLYLERAPQADDRRDVEILVGVLLEQDRQARGVRLVHVTAQPDAAVAVQTPGGWRELGSSPLDAELPTGAQVLRFRKQGFVDAEVAADVATSGQAVVAVLEPAVVAAPEPPPPVDDDLAAWGWATAGVGTGALVAAVILGVVADERAATANGLTPAEHARSEHDGLVAESDRFATAANVTYAVGGAALAAGITLLIVDAVQEEPVVTLFPTPIPGGALASGLIRF